MFVQCCVEFQYFDGLGPIIDCGLGEYTDQRGPLFYGTRSTEIFLVEVYHGKSSSSCPNTCTLDLVHYDNLGCRVRTFHIFVFLDDSVEAMSPLVTMSHFDYFSPIYTFHMV